MSPLAFDIRPRPLALRLSAGGLALSGAALLTGIALMACWSTCSVPLGLLSLALGSMALWHDDGDGSAKDVDDDLDLDQGQDSAPLGTTLRHLTLASLGTLVALQLLG
ncbi:hypothetical protein ACUN9Y_14555 [Halomonas sp. V046]|uniref:hypothetical protein n=1 Tax=Halomonas sp. V046 TaxID=3459611 RepID=UPI004044649F